MVEKLQISLAAARVNAGMTQDEKERLRAMRNVIDLQTAAVKSQEAATIAATRAHELSTKASIAQEEACGTGSNSNRIY